MRFWNETFGMVDRRRNHTGNLSFTATIHQNTSSGLVGLNSFQNTPNEDQEIDFWNSAMD